MKNIYMFLFTLVIGISSFAQTPTVQYNYDKLDRLKRVAYNNGYTASYQYDENGNRLKEITYFSLITHKSQFSPEDSLYYPFENIVFKGYTSSDTALKSKITYQNQLKNYTPSVGIIDNQIPMITKWTWTFDADPTVYSGVPVSYTFCGPGTHKAYTTIEYSDGGVVKYTNSISISNALRARTYTINTCKNARNVELAPPDGMLCYGSMQAIPSVYGGSGNYTYSWVPREDLINPDSAKPLIKIAGHSQIFALTVTDGITEEVTTGFVTVNVPDAPIIESQTISQEVCLGSNFPIYVITNSSHLQYQWQKNGVDMPGATSSTYTITDFSNNSEGIYRCRVIDSLTYGCTVLSDDIYLKPLPPTRIDSVQNSKTLCSGEDYRLFVKAEGKYLKYQWFQNNIPIVGADSSYYEIESIESSKAGFYYCLVTSSFCHDTVISTDMNISLADQVSTIFPKSRYVKTADSVVLELSNLIGTGFGSQDSLNIKWFKGNQQIMEQDGKYQGANKSKLTIYIFTESDAGYDYHVTVAGLCNSIESDFFALKSLDIIAEHPKEKEICEGESVEFSISTKNIPNDQNYIFQWYRNNEILKDSLNLIGTDKDKIIISNSSTMNKGLYKASILLVPENIEVFSNSAELKISDTLQIIENIGKNNKAFYSKDTLKLNLKVIGSEPISYQWYKDGMKQLSQTQPKYIKQDCDTNDSGIYYCLISNPCGQILSDFCKVDIINIISSLRDQVKSDIKLYQNIPNPFDDNTTVKFFTAEAGNVRLILSDVLGSKRIVLFDGLSNAGMNEVKISNSNYDLPSGVYFYTLTSKFSNVSVTLPMILTR